MDQFAKTIQKNGSSCQEEVALAYFEFWENYIDVLLLLKKAHLLYFIEDHLTELIANVAKKVIHNREIHYALDKYRKYDKSFAKRAFYNSEHRCTDTKEHRIGKHCKYSLHQLAARGCKKDAVLTDNGQNKFQKETKCHIRNTKLGIKHESALKNNPSTPNHVRKFFTVL